MTQSPFSSAIPSYVATLLHSNRYCKAIQQGELSFIECQHPQFFARISLQGAQLLSFCPTGSDDWLWQTQETRSASLYSPTLYKTGQAIRGGIPICLPWFGVNQENANKPKHGFVRNRPWVLNAVKESDEGVSFEFNFDYSPLTEADRQLFDATFKVHLCLTLSDTIQYSVSIQHFSEKIQRYSFALHSYFATKKLSTTKVLGLSDCQFLDNTESLLTKTLNGEQLFDREIDRVFENSPKEQTLILDKQQLLVQANNAPTCIVWNPGECLAQTMPDVGEQYQHYICVERGAAFNDALQLEQGQTHNFSMTISKV